MTAVAIIDYGIGNIRSIINAVEKVGATALLTNDKETILNAGGVILPGVGAFSHGMEQLEKYKLIDAVKEFSLTGKPLLGICLGMQMLFSKSYEFVETQGLDLIPGSVKQLKLFSDSEKKLPHVSWSGLLEKKVGDWDRTILSDVSCGENMYFVHSFSAIPEQDDDILSTTIYSDYEFCSSVRHGNIYGCQFHPEKSATEGLKIMKNFVRICECKNNV